MFFDVLFILKSVVNEMPKILKSVIWMLYRKIEAFIENHLRSDSDKILIIDGARQIGKTFIINHVGKKLFEN